MRKEIEQVKKEAKWASGSWFGVNVARLNLTPEEKRQLVAEGFRFTEKVRGKVLIMTYSQEARPEEMKKTPIINIDEDPRNANWLHQYKAKKKRGENEA